MTADCSTPVTKNRTCPPPTCATGENRSVFAVHNSSTGRETRCAPRRRQRTFYPRQSPLCAYDDVAGVTAAFDKNVLARINRELDGDFDLRQFDHEARWNREARRVEMHLRARSDMTIHIRKAQLTFQIGSSETIKTEDSYKFELDEIRDLSQRCGFRCSEQFVDSEWAFAQSLLIAQ